MQREPAIPRVVAWESTVACNLACVHCRAEAQTEPAQDEMNTAEVRGLIDDIASFATPILIISGGEPLMRPDIFEIARYAGERGLRAALSPNGTLIDADVAQRIKQAGVSRVSISIDGATAADHDAIRGVPGAFDAAVEGIDACRAQGLSFQINTTVMRQNVDALDALQQWAIDQGAAAWHLFMLVPTGRGAIDDEISPDEYEGVLSWIYDRAKTSPLPMRVTCGPQFMRIVTQRGHGAPAGIERPRQVYGTHGGAHGAAHSAANGARHPHGLSRGCLAADGYCFVSRSGEVYPCGYLPLSAGNVRERSFREIYQESELFCTLRDLSQLQGNCGACEYLRVCGGCRARAYAFTGNVLATDPLCAHQPRSRGQRGDS
jgi:AdoMet-dependent heme synthase